MATLIYGRKQVWSEILALRAVDGRKRAAIAYFSGGAKLEFRAGDLLIVDASAATVGGGGTSPSRLLKLLGDGVDVRHYDGLHAKVICFDPGTVVVGSMNASRSSQDGLFEAATIHHDKETYQAATEMMAALRSKSRKLQKRDLEALLDAEKAAAERGDRGGNQKRKLARKDGPVRGTESGQNSIYAAVTSKDSQSELAIRATEAMIGVRAGKGKKKDSFYHPKPPKALKELKPGDRLFLGWRDSYKDTNYDVYKDCRVLKVAHSEGGIVVVYAYDPNVMTLPFEKFKALVSDEGLKSNSAGRLINPDRIEDILDRWIIA